MNNIHADISPEDRFSEKKAHAHISIALRDAVGGYTRHAGALFASLMEHTSIPLRLHVLCDATVSACERDKLSSMAMGTEHIVYFYDITIEKYFPDITENNIFSHAAMYRLLLPDLQEFRHCSRIIYLDTDVIVDVDIAKLWNIDLQGALLGAVEDAFLSGDTSAFYERGKFGKWLQSVVERNQSLGIPRQSYFNSGVLLLDLQGIRRAGLFHKALDVILSKPSLTHPDQDALNIVFQGQALLIDASFNHLALLESAMDAQQGIWHYAGKGKPWNTPRVNKAAQYINFLQKTPWAAVDVAFALRDVGGDYARHAGALVASLLEHSSRCLRLHVLLDSTVSEQIKDKLKSMVRGTNHTLYFYHIDPENLFSHIKEHRHFTHASLYKLLLPRFNELYYCSRIIFLDADIIVDMDIAKLWDVDMKDALVGAVADPCLADGAVQRMENSPLIDWIRRMAAHNARMGVPTGEYFNAGVLLLNLQAIRKERLFQKALKILQETPKLVHPCQDALNMVFAGNTVLLPAQFNCLTMHGADAHGVSGIWHFAGRQKPGAAPHMPKAERYRYFVQKSPWALRAPSQSFTDEE